MPLKITEHVPQSTVPTEELLAQIKEKDQLIGQLNKECDSLNSECDKLTSENEKLLELSKKDEIQNLQSQLNDLQSKLKKSEERLTKSNDNAEKYRQEADYARNHVEIVTKEIEVEVPHKACERCNKDKYERKLKDLQSTELHLKMAYEGKSEAHEVMWWVLVIYSILITVIYAFINPVFSTDLKSTGNMLFNVFSFLWSKISGVAEMAALKVGGSGLLYLIFYWIIVIICMALIVIPLIIGIGKGLEWLDRNDYIDEIPMIIFFLSVAILVNLGQFIKPLVRINLVLLIVLIQVAGVLVRAFIKKRSEY